MRIAFLAWQGSIHTRRWVSFFAERGHEVHVITCGDGEASDPRPDGTAQPPGYPVHDLGRPRFGKVGYLLKLRRARRVVRRLQPEVVHAHFATSYGLLGLASGVRPFVVTAHGDDVLIAPRNPWMRRIVARVLRASSLITVPSEHMRPAVEALLGGRDVRVEVFQYGVDVPRLRAVADRVWMARLAQHQPPAGGREPIRLVSSRAFLALYRIDVVLEAVALLRDRGTAVTLDLVGDGPERDALRELVQRLELQELVTFHGQLPGAKVEEVVAAADIYVSVAESDGVSLALLEAMALGAIPVLSDIPANQPWVRNGETGVLVPIEPAALADGIERAASLDRGRVAADNRAVVAERADRDTNLGACEEMIDDLVGVTFVREPVRRRSGAA